MRHQIKALNKELESGRQHKSRAEKALRDVEKRIGTVSRSIREIDTELAETEHQLKQLNGQRGRIDRRLKAQSLRLGREARAAYAMGRQQQIKLLLNQEQPEAVGRMQVYFNYFSRARGAQIKAMRQTLDEIEQVEREIDLKTRSLADLRQQHQKQVQQLADKKKSRQQLVDKLARQLQAQGGELKRLQANEKELQALIHSLQELLSDIPAGVSEEKPFRDLKGHLRWPAQGRLATRFGSQRGNSGLKWRGVVIKAPAGGRVRAVSQGRVAFADWLRGFGLLLIIDHGDGYMSLYGHNQALYKEVGEWVDTGEVVAILGASGGQSHTGLYFEIRHKGRPVNPVHWCAGSPPGGAG